MSLTLSSADHQNKVSQPDTLCDAMSQLCCWSKVPSCSHPLSCSLASLSCLASDRSHLPSGSPTRDHRVIEQHTITLARTRTRTQTQTDRLTPQSIKHRPSHRRINCDGCRSSLSFFISRSAACCGHHSCRCNCPGCRCISFAPIHTPTVGG